MVSEDRVEARPTCQTPASGTAGVCAEGPCSQGGGAGLSQALSPSRPVTLEGPHPPWASLFSSLGEGLAQTPRIRKNTAKCAGITMSLEGTGDAPCGLQESEVLRLYNCKTV